MAITSIQIKKDTKSLLDEIKEKYSIGTYDNCINSMAVFMIKNEINPRDEFVGDFKKSLIDFEIRILKYFEDMQIRLVKDNTSLRKWVGAMEKTYFIPMNQKVSLLDKKSNYQFDNKNLEKENNSQLENTPNPLENGIEFSQDGLEEMALKLEEKSKEYSELYKENDELKNILFNIINNSKIETTGMLGKEKVVINMTSDEWEKVKQKL